MFKPRYLWLADAAGVSGAPSSRNPIYFLIHGLMCLLCRLGSLQKLSR